MSNQHVQPSQYTGPTAFVQTHSHTVYSAMDGCSLPSAYARRCQELGYPAMTATEHGNLASVPDMYTEFKKAGVKYFPGCEIYFCWDHKEYLAARRAKTFLVGKKAVPITAQLCNQSEDPKVWADYLKWFRSRHLTVLAKNQTGFTNLIKLTTDVHKYGYQNQRGRSRAWFGLLNRYREGLIILSGCLNGPLAYELKRRYPIRVADGKLASGKPRWRIREGGDLLPYGERLTNARRVIRQFRQAYGEDYFIELQMPLIEDVEQDSPFEDGLIDLQVFRDSIMLAEEEGIPYVLATDSHYMKREEHILQRMMMAIAQDVPLNSPDLFASNSSEQFMKTRAELWATFKNYPYSAGLGDDVFERMCDNTLLVAERCAQLHLDDCPKIPKFQDADAELRSLVYQRLRELKLDKAQKRYLIDGREVTYTEQAEIELERFIDKGFASYFLITADLVRYGKSQGYPFGPRGSAGGSIVCMLLGITSLDSLAWGLSFDRFMSPARGGYLLKTKMCDPVN